VVYFDNDALAGTDEDQGYSGGLSLSIAGASAVELQIPPSSINIAKMLIFVSISIVS